MLLRRCGGVQHFKECRAPCTMHYTLHDIRAVLLGEDDTNHDSRVKWEVKRGDVRVKANHTWGHRPARNISYTRADSASLAEPAEPAEHANTNPNQPRPAMFFSPAARPDTSTVADSVFGFAFKSCLVTLSLCHSVTLSLCSVDVIEARSECPPSLLFTVYCFSIAIYCHVATENPFFLPTQSIRQDHSSHQMNEVLELTTLPYSVPTQVWPLLAEINFP